MIFIENRKRSEKKLLEKYPHSLILDITSKANDPWVKLSPFYPHGNIPIPFSEGWSSKTVEGIWQGLKVFEKADIDYHSFSNDTMKNLKRTIRKFGKPLGHRKGIKGTELLSYLDARFQIYLPTYLWVLQNNLGHIIQKLRDTAKERNLILLDYETNSDILNLKKPVSHAYLVKCFIEGHYPTVENINEFKHSDKTEIETKRKHDSKSLNKKKKRAPSKKQKKENFDRSQMTLDI